ncbi:MAG: hypothetical protein ACYC7E_06120 [Armatimonadota bacterium]
MCRLLIVILWIGCGLLPALATDNLEFTGILPNDLASISDSGFTADTVLQLVLDEDNIDRYDWWLTHGFKYEMKLFITLTSGHGVIAGASNKIMIYGDRDEPRYSGESDWQLSPRPINIFFTPTQTTDDPVVVFGPPCDQPGSLYSWTQYYSYTAACNLVTGGSASDTANLAVVNHI